jgi:hypothetical protein
MGDKLNGHHRTGLCAMYFFRLEHNDEIGHVHALYALQ